MVILFIRAVGNKSRKYAWLVWSWAVKDIYAIKCTFVSCVIYYQLKPNSFLGTSFNMPLALFEYSLINMAFDFGK